MQMHEKQASHTFLAQFRPRLTPTHTLTKHTTPHQTHVYTNTTLIIPSLITRIETRHVWPCCLLLIVFETCCRRKRAALAKTEPIPYLQEAGRHTRPGPLLVAAWRFVIFPFTNTAAEKKKKDQPKHTRIHHDYHDRRSRPP